MDKYTKFILTTIAVGVLGLNYHMFKGDIISSAHASNGQINKIAICDVSHDKCADIVRDGGRYYLNVWNP